MNCWLMLEQFVDKTCKKRHFESMVMAHCSMLYVVLSENQTNYTDSSILQTNMQLQAELKFFVTNNLNVSVLQTSFIC